MSLSFSKKLGSLMLTLALAVFLVGCSGSDGGKGGGKGDPAKVTKDNFDKIKPQMTEQQVIDILGPPMDVNTPPNLPNMKGLIWTKGNNRINIAFKDGKAENLQSQFVP